MIGEAITSVILLYGDFLGVDLMMMVFWVSMMMALTFLGVDDDGLTFLGVDDDSLTFLGVDDDGLTFLGVDDDGCFDFLGVEDDIEGSIAGSILSAASSCIRIGLPISSTEEPFSSHLLNFLSFTGSSCSVLYLLLFIG